MHSCGNLTRKIWFSLGEPHREEKYFWVYGIPYPSMYMIKNYRAICSWIKDDRNWYCRVLCFFFFLLPPVYQMFTQLSSIWYSLSFNEPEIRKRAWRSGRASESKLEKLGLRPGDVAFETIQFYRRSSTFVKVCRKISIFIVKFSAGMSESFFDTCVNWSCVTRCGCRTTLSTLFIQCSLNFSLCSNSA